MKAMVCILGVLLCAQAWGAKSEASYFSCVVNEPAGKNKTVKVTVKFAVKGLEAWEGKGELLAYPGTSNDMGAIFVAPQEVKDTFTLMMNLNGQGGDLRLENGHLRLFGDGDGIRFTDLVIWNVDDETEDGKLEGYVRDYGPAYDGKETFKQFIKCKRSNKLL